MPVHKNLPKLDLNITNRCNFRCAHCAFDSGVTQVSELTLSELEKILRDTKDLGGERIDITGGEPTVRKDVAEIIKLGKSLDYKIELVTNGSLVSYQDLERFSELGLDSTAISLDGSCYEVFRSVRKVDKKTYKRVLKTIDNSVALGYYTKVNTVAFNSNIYDLPAIAQFCIDRGVLENGIYYFTPVGRGNSINNLCVEPLAWLEFIRKNLVKYDSKIKLSIEFPLIEKNFPKKRVGCVLEERPYHLQILPNGNVYPCALLASYNLPIGNLRHVSVKDVWNNSELWKQYRSKVCREVFEKYNGFCFDASTFTARDKNNYRFVCPIRKFRVGELK